MAGLLWMYQECTHELAEQWKSICEQFKPEDLQATFQFIHWSVKPRGLARGYKRLAQATNAVFVVVVVVVEYIV